MSSPSSEAINRIDTTLANRSTQIGNPEADSYTLNLLRNPNEAAKKFGSEVTEFTFAVAEEGPSATEAELADLLYAALVLARSKGQPILLGNVLQNLVDRNQTARSDS